MAKRLTKERLFAFADAILAIIMTILVLELPKPRTLTWAGIWELKASFLAFAVSFFRPGDPVGGLAQRMAGGQIRLR